MGDLSAGFLFSSMMIGMVGFAMLIYGKKAARVEWLAAGLAMCVFPYFVHSLVLMWAGAGGCMIGAHLIGRGN